MTYVTITDLGAAITLQEGSVVSKVVYKDEQMDVTVFGIDAGEGLTEHMAARAAIVHVLSGRLSLTVDGEVMDAGPGFWLHMEPGTPHSLSAVEPTVMLLTLV